MNKFSGTKILVVGDLMVDRYIWGNVNRISPEAPVPVVEVSREEPLRIGGAANVAHNILSLGGRPFVVGVVGDDERGRMLVEMLEGKGINTDGIMTVTDRPTTVKTRIYAHDQQVVRLDREVKTDIDGRTVSRIIDHIKNRLKDIKAIIISDYCKGMISRKLVKKIIEIAGERIFVSIDPKMGHFDYYNSANLVTPNIQEASFGSGVNISDIKTLLEAGDKLLKKYNFSSVLITRGGGGMSLFEKNGKITHIPAHAKKVYDVTGAGDTVIAAFTLCRASGSTMKKSAEFANRAACIVVGVPGTAVVSPNEIRNSLKKEKR